MTSHGKTCSAERDGQNKVKKETRSDLERRLQHSRTSQRIYKGWEKYRSLVVSALSEVEKSDVWDCESP